MEVQRRKKRYFFLTALLLIVTFITIFIPEKTNRGQMTPEALLSELSDNSRFFTADEVTKKMILKDPSLLLIDVRTPEEFQEYSLPGAINIPLADLFDSKWEEYLNQDITTNVFYSNGTIYSSQAWLLTRRMKYENNYIMKGGLNEWFSTIMHPIAPSSTADDSEIAIYRFRVAAKSFFGKGNVAIDESSDNKEKKPTAPVKKKPKKVEEEGGC